MAGRGRPPKDPTQRVNNHEPQRGEIRTAAATGWQHGEPAKPPSGLLKPSREAWDTWMRAWFAAFWTPDDIPALRQLIRLYDQVERGEFQRHNELRLAMDTYGITPKGQQDRRWRPPVQPAGEHQQASSGEQQRYGRLKVVGDVVESA